jgi:NAD(P)H dehydrogenase (quinone)
LQCLVVAAHPVADSLCMALCESAAAALAAQGHEVVIEDLYRQGFDPRLSEAERRSHYTPHPDASEVSAAAARLIDAEALLLVFPTWWFSLPAMLKGWFDRVWVPGVAFDNRPDFGPIEPRLLKLRHTLAVTTLGSPWWVDRLVMRQPVRRVLKTALIGACAPQCRFQMLSFYKCEKVSAERFAGFARRLAVTTADWS